MSDEFEDPLSASSGSPDIEADRETRIWRTIVAHMQSANVSKQKIVILNISGSGIMASADPLPAVDETLLVHLLDGQSIYMQVKWIRDNVFGAKSDSPIQYEHLLKDQ